MPAGGGGDAGHRNEIRLADEVHFVDEEAKQSFATEVRLRRVKNYPLYAFGVWGTLASKSPAKKLAQKLPPCTPRTLYDGAAVTLTVKSRI